MAKYEIITNKLNTYFTNNKISVASSKPGSGSWTKGDIVYSSTPTSMCYGWMCIESGTPGNWITLSANYLPLSGGTVTSLKVLNGVGFGDPNSAGTEGHIGGGVHDVYIHNKTSDKYLQLQNDGTLAYSNQAIYHSGNKPTWDDITGKPSSFPVAPHNHDSVYVNKLPTRIKNGGDLNNIRQGGNYVIEGGVLNAPCNYGRLVVLSWDTSNLWCTQIVYSDMNNMIYTRCTTNSDGKSWTAWSQVYSQNNIPEKAGSSDLTIQPMRSNEINFGGSYKDNTFMFFGYRSIEGRPAPTIYVFGGEGGTATVQAGDVTVKGHSVYSVFNKPPASSVTLQDSSNLFTATDVEGAMKELFTNVDNGKSSIAQAIIAKGVSGASKNDTFGQLSDKIRQIPDVTRCTGDSSGACFLDPLDLRDGLDGQENRIESDHSLRLEVYHDQPRTFKSFKLGLEGTMYCKLHGIKTATTTISVKSTENDSVLFTKALKTNVVTEFEFNVTKNSYIQIDITNHTNSQGAGIFLAINIWLRYRII